MKVVLKTQAIACNKKGKGRAFAGEHLAGM